MTEKAKAEDKKSEMTFEQSMERLEQIVKEMESGSLSLEDMISRFEEGQKLLKFCSSKLNEVERKIEVLVKKGDQMVPEEMETGEQSGNESGGSEEKSGELF
jgi:exodeoxyribonuclease VII small subunit